MFKRKIILTLVAALALALFSGAALADDGNQALMREIQALKAKLAEMDGLKARLAELEAKMDKQAGEAQKADKEMLAGLEDLRKAGEESGIKVGGALRFNYRNTDYNDSQKSRGGDGVFDVFRLNVDGEYKDMLISAEYRWYQYMNVLHHGWIGYNFTDDFQGQLGVTQVPFGILPWASHNWWFSLGYYVGLEDDYDLGVKFLYKPGPFDIQLAFFKNEEWGNPGTADRYSIDVVTDGDQDNRESNQVNLRLAYTLPHGDLGRTEFGLSGQFGQLYNGITDDNGTHYAAAAHINGFYGPVNLMLEAAYYKYDPENPAGVSDDTVLMGAYADRFSVASEAALYIAGISYDVPVAWGPVSNLQFYDDYSILVKQNDGFDNSQINTLGCLVTAGPVYTYIDVIFGKNALWVGDGVAPMAEGDPDAEWDTIFNINVGYYF